MTTIGSWISANNSIVVARKDASILLADLNARVTRVMSMSDLVALQAVHNSRSRSSSSESSAAVATPSSWAMPVWRQWQIPLPIGKLFAPDVPLPPSLDQVQELAVEQCMFSDGFSKLLHSHLAQGILHIPQRADYDASQGQITVTLGACIVTVNRWLALPRELGRLLDGEDAKSPIVVENTASIAVIRLPSTGQLIVKRQSPPVQRSSSSLVIPTTQSGGIILQPERSKQKRNVLTLPMLLSRLASQTRERAAHAGRILLICATTHAAKRRHASLSQQQQQQQPVQESKEKAQVTQSVSHLVLTTSDLQNLNRQAAESVTFVVTTLAVLGQVCKSDDWFLKQEWDHIVIANAAAQQMPRTDGTIRFTAMQALRCRREWWFIPSNHRDMHKFSWALASARFGLDKIAQEWRAHVRLSETDIQGILRVLLTARAV